MPASLNLCGFTLVELLVVVGIITILAGMLMVAVEKARASGRRVSCISNLRQIGAGLALYLNDHQRMPTLTNMPSLNLNNDLTMAEVIDPGSRELFRCPADKAGYFENEQTSYEWNVHQNAKLPGEKKHWHLDKIMWDYEPFHGEPGHPGSRNTLYLDSHVEGL
ncbi:MAG: type II secretion system protein [Candidatus Brocadiia bacterium]